MKLARVFACSALGLCMAIPVVAHSQSGTTSGGSASATTGPADSQKKRSMHAKKGQTRKQIFDRLDTNHDGMISRAEAQADPDLVVIFVDMDTNNDGQLSPVEFVIVPIALEDGTSLQ
jgi:hypothetical protein